MLSYAKDVLSRKLPTLEQSQATILQAVRLTQANAPTMVAGCYFESLSFGSSPIQIVGIKNSSFRTGADQLGIGEEIEKAQFRQTVCKCTALILWAVATRGPGMQQAGPLLGSDFVRHMPCTAVLDIDLRWAGTPDVTLKLLPSHKWLIKQMKIGAFCPLTCIPLGMKAQEDVPA